MNTSFPPVTVRADKTALADTTKRASVAKTDAEKETRFADFLPDRKAKQPDESDQAVHANALRPAPDDPDRTDRKTPAAVPTHAISIHQAVVAASVMVDPAPEAESADTATPDAFAAADVARDWKTTALSPGAGSPGIEPHGPPPTDGDDGTIPTGGIKGLPPGPLAPLPNPAADVEGRVVTGGTKTPQIEPHGPPGLPTDGNDDQPVTGGIKAPPIAPHDPPIVSPDDRAVHPVAANSVQDKPLVIRPHGPVNPPSTQFPATEDAPETTDPNPAASTLPAASVNPRAERVGMRLEPSNAPIPTPAAGMTPAGLTPFANPARRTEANIAPIQTSISAAADPANPPRPDSPVSPAFLITSSAQVQFAASTASAETVTGLDPREANLADPIQTPAAGNPVRRLAGSSQVNKREGLTPSNMAGGTTVARRLGSMTALPSEPETAADRDASSGPDKDGFSAVGLPDGLTSERLSGRAKDGDAAKASVAATLTPETTVATAQTAFAEPMSSAPSTGIVQVAKMETLLQTVQETAERVRFDGAGQMELRVRLDGVADEVTVRVHMDQNQQPQVNFQAGSPELRAALEQGWNDLKTSESVSSEARFDLPGARSMDDSSAPESYREGRRIFNAPASNGQGQKARRWSGYA